MNIDRPLIVFCTTCKGRAQHIEQTLPKNIEDNADYPACKFVVIDYNSKDHLDTYLKTEHRSLILSGKLSVYRYTGVGPFKMAHAKNLSHRAGMREGAEILVNLDADNFTGPGFATYVAEKFRSVALSESGGEALLWAKWNTTEVNEERIPKGCSGRIAVSTNTFLKSGGYDETKFATWGPDDKDFHFRVRKLGVVPQKIDRFYLQAVLHSDKMRFREYPEARRLTTEYHDITVENVDLIANYGQYGMGTLYRNFESHPVVFDAVPTRVFGIGLHKTSTTSLNYAFKLLRLDSAHWKSVKWARDIWVEMTETGRSPTLEQHYALSDLPIPMLFKELDKAYPGSKFILTVRNEEKWVQSVERHWSESNGFKSTWKKAENFGQEVHKLLYGQYEFDRNVMLERYRRHNQEVLEYFKGRPQDLLVMDMDQGQAGWLELCGFLKLPIPSEPYPMKFVTSASSSASA